jgi:hypothetical protein
MMDSRCVSFLSRDEPALRHHKSEQSLPFASCVLYARSVLWPVLILLCVCLRCFIQPVAFVRVLVVMWGEGIGRQAHGAEE